MAKAQPFLRTYSLRRVVEGGGISQKEAIAIAKDKGAAKVERGYSPYVGYYGVDVWAIKSVHNRIAKEF